MLLVGFSTSVGALLGVAIERQETNPAWTFVFQRSLLEEGTILCFRDHFLEEAQF